MDVNVKVFVIPAKSAPGTPPRPGKDLAVDAASLDAARSEAARQLVAAGFRVRAVSFGAIGLVAYVEER